MCLVYKNKNPMLSSSSLISPLPRRGVPPGILCFPSASLHPHGPRVQVLPCLHAVSIFCFWVGDFFIFIFFFPFFFFHSRPRTMKLSPSPVGSLISWKPHGFPLASQLFGMAVSASLLALFHQPRKVMAEPLFLLHLTPSRVMTQRNIFEQMHLW